MLEFIEEIRKSKKVSRFYCDVPISGLTSDTRHSRRKEMRNRRIIKRAKLVRGTNPRRTTREKATVMIVARAKGTGVLDTRAKLIAAGILKVAS